MSSEAEDLYIDIYDAHIARMEQMKARFENSLFDTARVLCGFKDINKKTHGPIIKVLESDLKRKLIVAPRGSLKTSLCAIAYPIWRILRNPDIRILIDSELFTNSKSHISTIKQHLETTKIRFLWGNLHNSKNWAANSFTVATRTKTLKDPTAQAGGLGTKKIGAHVDMWILDDMNSPQNVKDKEAAKKVIDHYRYGLSILEPDGEIICTGTRYSELDLIGHILENEIGE